MRFRFVALLAILGPGFITANVDNDPGGILTYSQAGAKYGYTLLWTLVPTTVALIVVFIGMAVMLRSLWLALAAELALARVRKLDDPALDRMIAAVLAESIPADALVEHIYVSAALQAHFARLAARMDGNALVPVGVGVCPVCGGRPVVSLVVGWYGAEGARYASCMLCATLWNEVRVKCLVCGSTKGIGYQEVDGHDGTVKAETCDECGSYVKVLYEHKNVQLEPMADDVGSLALDQLLRDSAYSRGGINPYLAGY